jgi:hypothetical protein
MNGKERTSLKNIYYQSTSTIKYTTVVLKVGDDSDTLEAARVNLEILETISVAWAATETTETDV